jgi:peptidoglycan-associated lipoprotein
MNYLTRRHMRHTSIFMVIVIGLVGVSLVAGLDGCGKRHGPGTNVTEKVEKPVTPPTPPPTPKPEDNVTKEPSRQPLTLNDVFFDYDKANLREDARTTLESDANSLQQNPDARALLEGHCDERGTVEYNLALGERRAQSAKNFLVQYGIDPSRLSTISFGKERPFVKGHDESAWSEPPCPLRSPALRQGDRSETFCGPAAASAAGSCLFTETDPAWDRMGGGRVGSADGEVKAVARIWIALPIVVLVACGCYGAKAIRQPIAVDVTEQNVKAMMEQQSNMSAAIRDLQERSEKQEEMIRALRADTQTRFLELSEAVESMGNRVSENMERRKYAPPPEWSAAGGQLPGRAVPADTTGPADDVPLSPAQSKAIYDAAYLDLNRGNYSLALLGFQDYLSKAPASELADNAQYWIGECYYAQRDFKQAIEEFSKVTQNYPNGDKVAAALLKIAYSHLQLDDRAAARSTLRDLIRQFPKSDEAAQARAKLSSLE